jgi:hypothetical protein
MKECDNPVEFVERLNVIDTGKIRRQSCSIGQLAPICGLVEKVYHLVQSSLPSLLKCSLHQQQYAIMASKLQNL